MLPDKDTKPGFLVVAVAPEGLTGGCWPQGLSETPGTGNQSLSAGRHRMTGFHGASSQSKRYIGTQQAGCCLPGTQPPYKGHTTQLLQRWSCQESPCRQGGLI